MEWVDPPPNVAERIDSYLTYLIREWKAIPLVAAEWDKDWEELDKLDFVLEWPIREDRLHELKRWDDWGLFSPAQRTSYEELLKLVAEHHPVLEDLLREPE